MPLPDTVETYKYFITEAEKIGVAYITLVRYSPTLDAEFDGLCLSHSFLSVSKQLIFYTASTGKQRATKHDVLETFRPFIKTSKLFLNAGVTVEEGEQLIAAGKVDGIFIGFNWITHPDLLKRVLHSKPLDNIPDIPHLQTKTESGDWSVGYTDYPVAVY